ncbi:hypothetical protein AA101099_2927 [Neoasaia chiangmaiensis NBRC 101099]|uniref:MobA/VirD2-like nuclease domain-containing protein n=1 Tax=Neoasaia chiangmaiensis TaxID=320497 RepID=A0A1U9KNU2_9PROT|nr:relaxase/mobilization nuclease domain-containing protein [Neoasaia chiangmaiensis]AQS87466.1 hypothetical protein A0U93_05395 [Neoasaia chiangmaiensis]GBR42611.1 hypothetical protein AA101099_2927 [Neoasaia chiangmaiensis NBRC 101099]GEN16253.1 hypothetical protein NCH01_26840 [Neoasaia chiangmaiensis]
MILKSNPIKTASGSGAIYHHLVGKTGDNEHIHVWKGRRQDIDDCIADATAFGRVNAVQHFQLSSREKLTTEQFGDCIVMLAQEFGFRASDVALAVIHTKTRHDGEADNRHCHILVRTTNAETGKVLDVSHRYERQEKVARLFELKHGLELTKGRHNLAVYHAMPEEYRERLQVLCEGALPNSVLSDRQSRRSQRQGARPFDIKYVLRDLYAGSTDWQAFQSAISSQGWSLMAGNKKTNVVLLKDEHGVIVGSLSRLLGVRKAEFSAFAFGQETPEQSAIRQGHKEDIASPGPRDTSQGPTGKGETPVDPRHDSADDSADTSTDSASSCASSVSGALPTRPVPTTHWLGTDVPLSRSTRAQTAEGMSHAEILAVIDFNAREAEKDGQLRDLLHEQKRFAEMLSEITTSFASRWTHLPPEPFADPKSRTAYCIRQQHERRLESARQRWKETRDRSRAWKLWNASEVRQASEAFEGILRAYGYDRHDVGKLDLLDDGNFAYATRWMAEWFAQGREQKHRTWQEQPEVQRYLKAKADTDRLVTYLERTRDVDLLMLARDDPQEALKRLASLPDIAPLEREALEAASCHPAVGKRSIPRPGKRVNSPDLG